MERSLLAARLPAVRETSYQADRSLPVRRLEQQVQVLSAVLREIVDRQLADPELAAGLISLLDGNGL